MIQNCFNIESLLRVHTQSNKTSISNKHILSIWRSKALTEKSCKERNQKAQSKSHKHTLVIRMSSLKISTSSIKYSSVQKKIIHPYFSDKSFVVSQKTCPFTLRTDSPDKHYANESLKYKLNQKLTLCAILCERANKEKRLARRIWSVDVLNLKWWGPADVH